MHRRWDRRLEGSPMPQIFDAFMFSGEVELLETRIHLLAPVVDKFVLVEADISHSGSSKRKLMFPTVQHRFSAFRHQIWYKALRSKEVALLRTCAGEHARNSYRAAMRCEHVMRGSLFNEVLLAGARPTDILVSSDADEIPRPEFLRVFKDCDIFGPMSDLQSHPTVIILLADMYM
jgi:beta-1,4-mannosyl-glycoprotein beta-1,4-N-acetylglucosaminyltransferase